MKIKITFIRLSSLALLLFLCPAWAETAQNIRVVWADTPQTAATMVWDGDSADASAVLLYDTVSRKDGARQYAFKVPVSEAGFYEENDEITPPEEIASAAEPHMFYHHAPLRGLKPGTVYYLAVESAEGIGREYHFRTAPEDGQPFKIVYAGDSRTDLEIARSISMQLSVMIEEDDSIAALLHGGDYAVTSKRAVWKEWLDAYDLTTTDDGKLLPIIPIIGNHDVPNKSPIFRQAYGYPGGEDDYYLLRLTPSVGIVALNTEISAEGAQRKFLRKALSELNQEQVKWQIAAFHKPAFPAVKKPSAAKVSWVPLFEEFNIDLVLESDGHCIKRTVPIRGDQESADGIVYLGEGGYGAPQRDPKTDRWYIQGDNAFASKGNHIMMLEITPDAINYSTILNSGETVDSATFKPRR